ncbi:UbiX family flavin prenyltransferase [Sulfuracidifex tepidarius]|uniref:Flavin prenyltransferase UbiX n=1 Tax=Sulfuracidifex tepidarius TaxID=1294262 RepID=A0A510E4H4_9CREN|nr:UbiX family flavin prenyltransferase [Sulfuracidifex tepidarius]BBG24223.1 Flavin prenyltransferase UbiX [Sulfuracidifex tepidarius]BBG26980.1 Flavin prenyltransferase UbiX [Sulfuracidifex tepidarius]
MDDGMAKETGTNKGREKGNEVTVAITGASGIIYGLRTVEELVKLGYRPMVILSREAEKVARIENGFDLRQKIGELASFFMEEEIDAPMSSSSYTVWTLGMAIIPCSVKSMAEIANGIASNLVSRAALNYVRTGGKLVLVVRETPLGAIELENALKLARLGVIFLPASPGFYTMPKSIDDMVNFVVGKTLDMLGIKHEIYNKWKGTRVL